jgi:hypothetical protein
MNRSGKNSYGRRSQTLGFCPVAQRLTIRLVGRDVVARHYAMFVCRAHHERRRGMETKGLLDHRLQVLQLREVGFCNSSVQANDVIDFCLQLGKDWRSGECAPSSIRLWCSPLNVSQAIALTFFSEMNSSPSISWWLRSASTVSTSRCESPSCFRLARCSFGNGVRISWIRQRISAACALRTPMSMHVNQGTKSPMLELSNK